MAIVRNLLIFILTCAGFSTSATAGSTNWHVYVAFVEVERGAINKLPESYQMAWVRRDANEKDLGKAFKKAQKAAVAGSKNKIYTREAFTNSTKFLAIYKYTDNFEMWHGSPKKMSALTMKKGQSVERLDKQMQEDASLYHYLDYSLVTLFDLQAAKDFLNAQPDNPFLGEVPTVNLN